MYLFLVDAHLMLGDLDAPLFDDVADEPHRLILQQFLRLLLVEVILCEDLLHEFGVDVRALAFDHVEGLTVHQLLLDLVLGQVALALQVVHHRSCGVQHRTHRRRLLHQLIIISTHTAI